MPEFRRTWNKSNRIGIFVGIALAISVAYFQFRAGNFFAFLLIPYISVILISGALAVYFNRRFPSNGSGNSITEIALISSIATILATLFAGQLFMMASTIVGAIDGAPLFMSSLLNMFTTGVFVSWIFVATAWPALLATLFVVVVSSPLWNRGD